VRVACGRIFGGHPLLDVEADAIAPAVLRAALTAEPSGAWRVTHEESVHGTEWWAVTGPDETDFILDTEAEARACANALNLLATLTGAPHA
jgi:hypothetical protein